MTPRLARDKDAVVSHTVFSGGKQHSSSFSLIQIKVGGSVKWSSLAELSMKMCLAAVFKRS